MIITKLLQKYSVGCERGMSAVSEPNLQFVLNRIIDWQGSEFENIEADPEHPEIKATDNHDPFLEPGDCFCIGTDKEKTRMVLAMDKGDQVVCILNDTGILALDRVLQEKIKPEYELLCAQYRKVDVRQWSPKVTATDLGEDLFEIPVNKNKYRVMKDRLLQGRGIQMPEAYIEAIVVSDDTLGMEIPLYLTKYSIYTKATDNMFTDIPGFLEDLVDNTLAWFYNEVPAIYPPKKTETPQDSQQP